MYTRCQESLNSVYHTRDKGYYMNGRVEGLLCHLAGKRNSCQIISCRVLVNVSSNLLFQKLKKCDSVHLRGPETLCILNDSDIF